MEGLVEKMRVPYGMTVHGEEEIAAVVEVLKTSTQMGKNVRKMEERVAELYGKKHGIMVNSGSSALYVAMELFDLNEGDEVITPALTFSTTVGSIVRNKLIPAFVDVEESTYNIDADKVEAMITDKTKAMVIPNLIGNLPDWQKLSDIAKKHNLVILEDSADTLGATIGGKSSGRFSDISTTSFYGSHVINCAGNGGMLCVNTEKFDSEARLLRSWGRSSSLFVESEKIENRFNVELEGIQYDAKFVFDRIGYNLEPSEMGAAFGLVQLDKLNDNIQKRVENYNKQMEFFKKYEDWFILPEQLPDSVTGWLAFPIIVKEDAPFMRTEMQVYLEKQDIQTRVVFTGNILRQPGFRNVPHKATPDGYAMSDQVMRGGTLLACHHGLTQEMLDYVHSNFEDFAKKF